MINELKVYAPSRSSVLVKTCDKLSLKIRDLEYNSGPHRWYGVEVPQKGYKTQRVLCVPQEWDTKIVNPESLPVKRYGKEKRFDHGYAQNRVPVIELKVQVGEKTVSFIETVFDEQFRPTGFGWTCWFDEAWLNSPSP